MINRIIRAAVALLAIIGLLGSVVISQPEVAQAGSNGQQLQFYNYSGYGSITYLSVSGTGYHGSPQSWSRSFSPGVGNYSLNGWWWKGNTSVSWRMSDGRSGGCSFYVPVSQSGDWNQVGVARGSSCWFS